MTPSTPMTMAIPMIDWMISSLLIWPVYARKSCAEVVQLGCSVVQCLAQQCFVKSLFLLDFLLYNPPNWCPEEASEIACKPA